MDNFPPGYVAISRPLVVLSGLTRCSPVPPSKPLTDRGPRITSESPPVEGGRAEALLAEFLSFDGGTGRDAAKPSSGGPHSKSFRIRAVGRDYVLPRKLAPPSRSLSPPTGPLSPRPSAEGHSPLSPLCQLSPLFPDGLMTPLWLDKHQEILPAVFVSFFALSSNPEYDTLNDNLLKSEINALKSSIADSQHRTKLAVCMVGDGSTLNDPALDDRLENIRRATKLDSKSSYFFLPVKADAAELSAFVQSVLSALRSTSAACYSELAKHARRKKDKASSPPPSSASTPGLAKHLDSRGWSARYAFKQAIFCEFNREVDSASRHFAATLGALLDPGGMFNGTSPSSWSPRWNEARLFADATAIRHVRCLLSNGLPSAAVRAQRGHLKRVHMLVTQAGKSTQSYAWSAWEAMWAECMARLVAECGELAIDSNAKKTLEPVAERGRSVYAAGEKVTTTEDRGHPWDRLHHAGYWLKVAAERTQERRRRAAAIAEEDRNPPDQSPAHSVARRFEIYESYLCPEPHVEYVAATGPEHQLSQKTTRLFRQSLESFSNRAQAKMSDYVKLIVARELMETEQHAAAMSVLGPLWRSNSWRANGWYTLLRACAIDLHLCAKSLGDSKTQLMTLWELMNSVFEPSSLLSYDVMASVRECESEPSSVAVELRDSQVTSFLNATVTFTAAHGYVGEPCEGQVALVSHAHEASCPITFTNVVIEFENLIPPITISHEPNPEREILDERLKKGAAGLNQANLHTADLNLGPKTTVQLKFPVIAQSPGTLRVSCLVVYLKSGPFTFKYILEAQHGDIERGQRWRGLGAASQFLGLGKDAGIEILPKPPKVFADVANLRSHYYTNEYTILEILVNNRESESASISLDLTCVSDEGNPIEGCLSLMAPVDSESDKVRAGTLRVELGRLAAGSDRHVGSVSFRAPASATEFKFEIKTTYYLDGDAENLISKTNHQEVDVLIPFSASYSIKSDIRPHWSASPFTVWEANVEPDLDKQQAGMSNVVSRWSLRATFTSQARELLQINRLELAFTSPESLDCCTIVDVTPRGPTAVSPGKSVESSFTLDVTKPQILDSKHLTINTALVIHWRRPDSPEEEQTATALEVPSLVLPCNEPRALARVRLSERTRPTIFLEIFLENPSLHFLSFTVSLEGSDDFAYSGPRASTLHCLPLSRRLVQYALYPFAHREFIYVRPKVFDKNFNKLLHIHATGNLRFDQHGIRIWIGEHEP